ncbi:MAG: tetratricopeptide repeat protein [Oligoflexales bacterium]|nr:tetratricopeptide repeat protein [Oligoflexales bacterium]
MKYPFAEGVYFVCCISFFLASCNGDTNILGLTVPSGHLQAYDAQVAIGQAYYHQGDFDAALEHAELAVGLNPDSEAAAVLLGYVYLAKAGITIFGLASKLNEDEEPTEEELEEGEEDETEVEEEVEEDNSGDEGDDSAGDEENTEDEKGSGAGDALAGLDGIIGLSPAEFNLMGTVNNDVPSLPVIEPACAGIARQAVEKLVYMNKAVSTICRFVDVEARLPEDARHRCKSAKNRTRRAESHILWAFAHLTEAIAFYSVMNYNTTGRSKSNLELRVQQLESINFESLADLSGLITAIESLAVTIDRVLQITGFCSPEHPETQLIAMINDLMSVSFAFSRLPGLPKKMTESINKSIEKIRQIRETTSGFEGTQEQARAAKGDLTKKMTEVIGGAISKVNPNDFSEDQASEVCASFDIIKGGGESAKIPEVCE